MVVCGHLVRVRVVEEVPVQTPSSRLHLLLPTGQVGEVREATTLPSSSTLHTEPLEEMEEEVKPVHIGLSAD